MRWQRHNITFSMFMMEKCCGIGNRSAYSFVKNRVGEVKVGIYQVMTMQCNECGMM